MEILCTESFKVQFEKLVKNKSYKSLERELIDYFFNESQDPFSGTRLNGHATNPFIKKRLEGSGGFRTYYYIVVKENCLYLVYVHPKTGKYGIPNITDTFKHELGKEVLEAIKTGNVFFVKADIGKINISFFKKLIEV